MSIKIDTGKGAAAKTNNVHSTESCLILKQRRKMVLIFPPSHHLIKYDVPNRFTFRHSAPTCSSLFFPHAQKHDNALLMPALVM